MYSETAGIALLRMSQTIPPKGDPGRARAIHYAMFKLAQDTRNFAGVTGIEVASGLRVDGSYKSEWSKIVNLVTDLREHGDLK